MIQTYEICNTKVMELPYPNPRCKKTKTHKLSNNRLNENCLGRIAYPQVTKLCVEKCSFDNSDLSFLRYYPSLVKLEISKSDTIETIDAIANCPRLQGLKIANTRVKCLHGLEFCRDLKSIHFYRVYPPNLDALNGMKLISLHIWNSKYNPKADILTHLPEILPSLKSLISNDTNSIVTIPSYPKLTYLELSGQNIKEISHQPKVKNVIIRRTSICDLEFLRGSPVVRLACDGNKDLTSIDALNNSNIISIQCINNKLTRLPSMPQLVSLNCSGNKIYTLKDLVNSPNLISLTCSRNSLLNLRGLENMKNLKSLNASNNDIFDISAIKNFSSFDYLFLSNNMIIYLPDCKFLNTRKRYVHYYFDHNLIEDITHLTKNTGIWVYLFDNPLNPESLQMCCERYRSRGFVVRQGY
jgi:Leucine-rich repeat (LRR) protein